MIIFHRLQTKFFRNVDITVLNHIFLSNRLLKNFVFEDCNENEIISIISSLDKTKSSGPNTIPTDILFLLKDYFSIPLMHIFNLSFHIGQHPDLFKRKVLVCWSAIIDQFLFYPI